jgi:hypothetical protein
VINRRDYWPRLSLLPEIQRRRKKQERSSTVLDNGSHINASDELPMRPAFGRVGTVFTLPIPYTLPFCKNSDNSIDLLHQVVMWRFRLFYLAINCVFYASCSPYLSTSINFY